MLSKINTELLLKIIATIIAIFGIFQYINDIQLSRETERKKEAIDRIILIDSDRFRESRRNLFNFWQKNRIITNAISSREMTYNEYKNIITTIFDNSPDTEKLNDSVYSLMLLYDDVYFCLASEICDPKIIRDFYCKKAAVTYKVYRPVVEVLKHRSGYEDFGRGLARLTEECDRN